MWLSTRAFSFELELGEKREYSSAQENCFSPSPGTCADCSAFQPFAQERKKSLRKKRGRRKVASAKQRLQVAYHFISFPPLGAECCSAFSGSERARAFSVSVVEPSSYREQLFGGVLFYFVVYCWSKSNLPSGSGSANSFRFLGR